MLLVTLVYVYTRCRTLIVYPLRFIEIIYVNVEVWPSLVRCQVPDLGPKTD